MEKQNGKYGTLVGKKIKVIFVDGVSSNDIHTSNKIGVLQSYDNNFLFLKVVKNNLEEIEGLPIQRIIRIAEVKE